MTITEDRAAVFGRARLTRVHVRLTKRAGRFRAHVKLELTEISGGENGIVLDYAACPLPLHRIQASVGSIRDLFGEVGRSELLVEFPRHSCPSILYLSFELDWHPGDLYHANAIPFLLLPDFCPRPLRTIARATLPAVTAEVNSADISIHSISLPRGDAPVQLALFAHEGWQVRDAEETTLAVSESGLATGPVLSMIDTEIRLGLAFLSRIFGVSPVVRVLVLAPSTPVPIPNPASTVLIVDPRGWGLADLHPGGLRTIGTALLANLWWGVGVRMAGTTGAALAHGVAQWASVHRARSEARDVDTAVLLRMLDGWARITSADSTTDTQGIAARIALALDERQSLRGDVDSLLCQLTHYNIGLEVSARDVVGELARNGLNLPVSF